MDTMQVIDPQATVGELVRAAPARARVFESLRMDYCCGGGVPLAEACARSQVDLEEVTERLRRADADPREDTLVDADAMTLAELADHIEATHHAYLREELPELDRLTEKVAQVHGDKDSRLATVRTAFLALKAELEPHMMKEERILFPIVRQLEASDGPVDFHCGSVANPIRQMEHEHDQAGSALAVLREATDGFDPPEWACNTYRVMLHRLERLERDMHQHIHKENNVLFPKAIQLEASLLTA